MTLLDLQRRIREAGRIRIGQQVPTGKGRTRPEKLEHFRLTSPDRRAIEQAAGMYGGTPKQWDAPAGKQWEVVTQTDELDVIIPPSDMSFSQHYEMWAAGGCQRRCDSVHEQISDGPCLCDPENRECAPHTRLSVMLRDLAGLGVWRLDTQGFYAAVELAGAVQIVQAAAGAGVLLPARLRLEQRIVKRPGVGTRRFAVPVLDVEVTPAQLLGGQGGGFHLAAGETAAAPALGPATPGEPAPAQLPAGTPGVPAAAEPVQGALTPVPETVPERPVASVADQIATPRQQRKSQAAPIPSTGLAPRTAAQAAAGEPAPRLGEPEGVEPVDAFQTLTVAQIKLRLRDAGLPLSGAKDELVERLRAHADSQTSGSAPLPEVAKTGSVAPPPPPDEEYVPAPSFDRQGAQKAFHARLRELDLDYQREVRGWMEHRYRATLSEISDGQLSRLLDAMEKTPQKVIDSVRNKPVEAGGADSNGGAPPADTTAAAAEPAQDQCDVCGATGDAPHDSLVHDKAEAAQAEAARQPTPAERAHARADRRLDQLRERIHQALDVLRPHPEVFEPLWDRLDKLVDGRAASTDWSGADALQLEVLLGGIESKTKDLRVKGLLEEGPVDG